MRRHYLWRIVIIRLTTGPDQNHCRKSIHFCDRYNSAAESVFPRIGR